MEFSWAVGLGEGEASQGTGLREVRLSDVKWGYDGVIIVSLSGVRRILPQKFKPRSSFHARSPSVVG